MRTVRCRWPRGRRDDHVLQQGTEDTSCSPFVADSLQRDGPQKAPQSQQRCGLRDFSALRKFTTTVDAVRTGSYLQHSLPAPEDWLPMAFRPKATRRPRPRGSNLRVHSPRLAAFQRAFNRYLPIGCRVLDSCTTFTVFWAGRI